jgi:hypothetical protein
VNEVEKERKGIDSSCEKESIDERIDTQRKYLELEVELELKIEKTDATEAGILLAFLSLCLLPC